MARTIRAPFPIRVEPAPEQLAAITAAAAGRRVVIVGSAPRPIPGPAVLEAGEIAIPVNGGISSTAGPLALWIVGSKPYDKPGHPVRDLHRLMLDQAAHRDAAHVAFMRQPAIASEGLTIEALERRHVRIGTYSVIDKPTKRWLEGECCGRTDESGPCSTGLFAAAAACWAGAARVRLVGFSLKPGYQYAPRPAPPAWWRNHVDADALALVRLRVTYGDRIGGDVYQELARDRRHGWLEMLCER